MERHIARAPGPRGKPVVGSLPERRRDPIGLFMNAAQKYGPVVHMKMGPRTVVFLSDSDAIKHVLIDNAKNYIKGFGYDKLEPILGKGLLTNEGESWRQQRKLAQPAFHRQRLQSLTASMARATRDLLKDWEHRAESVIDVHQHMNRLTMKIVSLTLLGTDLGESESAAVGRALANLIEEANRRIVSLMPVPLAVPTPRNLKSRQSIKILNEVVFRIIQEHRKTEGQPDLLQMLMAARDETSGIGMTDEQLRDEVMTIFLAGHETTANALTWTFYLLSQFPEVERKLYSEASAVLQGRDATFDDLPRLKYTQMVIEESLRLYPPAWLISREATAPDKIMGFAIPKGTIVVMSPYVCHRSEKFWENPEGFDPERFRDPDVVAKRPKFAYFPFGGGPRQCIGNHFAMMEAQIVLSMVVNRYRLDLLPGHPVEPEPLITLRPRYGVKMRLKQRGNKPQTSGQG